MIEKLRDNFSVFNFFFFLLEKPKLMITIDGVVADDSDTNTIAIV